MDAAATGFFSIRSTSAAPVVGRSWRTTAAIRPNGIGGECVWSVASIRRASGGSDSST